MKYFHDNYDDKYKIRSVGLDADVNDGVVFILEMPHNTIAECSIADDANAYAVDAYIMCTLEFYVDGEQGETAYVGDLERDPQSFANLICIYIDYYMHNVVEGHQDDEGYESDFDESDFTQPYPDDLY